MQYRRAVRYDHVHSFCNNLCYQRRDLSRVAFRCADHNLDLRGSGVAGNPQPAQDRLDARSSRRFGARIDKADSWDFRRRLRPRSHRPSRRRTAKKRDELASLHVPSQAQETALYRLKPVL